MKLAVNLPLALYWATLAESTFDIDGLAEDLALAIAWGRKQGDTLPLAEAARPLYEAAQAEGLGGFDGASLSRHAASR